MGTWILFGAIAAFLFWLIGAYNRLIALRGQVQNGWKQIDVQLKRRHDLIPGLVAACAGLADHETGTQAALAAMRAQQQATPPGEAGADFAGLARTLGVVIERYPDLMAQAGFARLHEELVATEQRVALARAYYNDIATAYATRLEHVPDRWVARLGRMRPPPLLGAADFERAPVNVHLA